ncbi:hypothetical protein K435DRAFT_974047 [Dendrothele bispora CBS 962.96]|uniref:DUF6593 domain-containing protein n=1 Tax=Dendrothele bispora (strain CBS 962.96) TaxID=1314807 RepID=A0A4S8KNN3_DENBC|nr:hypothetical protein K435DRAFT_974047 [Dendrothele bispora CBS 962.96]
MKELTFSAAKDLLLAGDLLNTDIIDPNSGQRLYVLHTPQKSGLKGINKLDSFTVDVHKIVTAEPSESGRELVGTIEKHAFHADLIKLGDKEIKPLEWSEKKNKLEFTDPSGGLTYQWICEGNNFRLIHKSDPFSEVAVFKQGERIPISERLETGQDKPEQRWVSPMLSINVGDTQSELFHLVLATFVYYAKIKIEAMGGFASIQSTGTYSAGISNVVSGGFAAS